jgi:hypothetical protein
LIAQLLNWFSEHSIKYLSLSLFSIKICLWNFGRKNQLFSLPKFGRNLYLYLYLYLYSTCTTTTSTSTSHVLVLFVLLDQNLAVRFGYNQISLSNFGRKNQLFPLPIRFGYYQTLPTIFSLYQNVVVRFGYYQICLWNFGRKNQLFSLPKFGRYLYLYLYLYLTCTSTTTTSRARCLCLTRSKFGRKIWLQPNLSIKLWSEEPTISSTHKIWLLSNFANYFLSLSKFGRKIWLLPNLSMKLWSEEPTILSTKIRT